MRPRIFLYLFFFLVIAPAAGAQLLSQPHGFTHADTLRGSNGVGRNWWDVKRYDINITVDILQKKINGFVELSFDVLEKPLGRVMQIDLQEPMQIEKITLYNKPVLFSREQNVYWVKAGEMLNGNTRHKIKIYFSGTPREAKMPPWDGGWIWKKDSLGRPFVSVACQGLGGSVWYPCKDAQFDEVDRGASLTVTVPDTLVAVGNGRLVLHQANAGHTATYQWNVANPINNYLITPYIGKYVNFTDTLHGEKGTLGLSYWVLDYNLQKAKKHFEIVKPMLHCFEYWMGPYPFYEDGYKLVEAPHLGMEHQSGIAYGNKYLNGYLGHDRSGSGWGSGWDFIIVHESGHEWFANNITANDIADMWVHEAFTTYSETLFVQWLYGIAAAKAYVQGQRKNILNNKPIIGAYGVNNEGSSDQYDKGASMLHIIRQVINNDDLFRQMLRGLNKTFYHQTVTGAQVEAYINKKSGKDFSKIFNQYLRTANVPVLAVATATGGCRYRWENVVPGFNMPLRLTDGSWIYPTENFKFIKKDSLQPHPDFYITVERASALK